MLWWFGESFLLILANYFACRRNQNLKFLQFKPTYFLYYILNFHLNIKVFNRGSFQIIVLGFLKFPALKMRLQLKFIVLDFLNHEKYWWK